ncbi:hypothetical protein [Spiroplasma taiwanense]|uniref:hypothetical protein n=1 Tax=Spiroplasma taiwanense TaxID=2145 RepID=UPI0005A155D9|nr:hypothetical protein [Spiroplasma taiwanense]
MFFANVLIVSSLVITLCSIVPSIFTNMSNEYYRNIKYNNDYNYTNTISNNPLTRYSFYQSDENIRKSNMKASIFNVNIKDLNSYKNLISTENIEYWANKSNVFRSSFDNVLTNILLTFKGGLISSGVMEDFLNYAKQVDSISKNTTNSKWIQTNFNNFTCQVMPTLFG